MKQRVIFGALFALITLSMIVFSTATRVLFFVVCFLIACWEMRKALKKCGFQVELWPAVGICVFGTVLLCLNKAGYIFPACMIVVIALFAQMILTGKPNVKNVFATLSVLVYPLSPILLMVYISVPIHAVDPIWPAIFLNAIFPAIVSDTFALFGGKKFGKHKLSPHISPNKTVEGLICGLTAALLSGIAVHYILVAFSASLIPLWAEILTAFVAAVAGAFGDLAASSVKREAGIKDYSNLIPGHGGMLDRADSTLFSIPACFMVYAFFI
ncbi:MAG: phosphatidate cytidylyltransferase [Clostridia bacterium]|nr:phosphatidate cytidylyltransferase [Clostridia bacterium]